MQTFSDLTFESDSFSKLTSSGVKNKDQLQKLLGNDQTFAFHLPPSLCHEERVGELGLPILGDQAWRDRTRGNGFPLTQGRAGWDFGKELFPVRRGGPGTEKPHPWKCPRLDWMGLGAVWDG